MNRNIIFDSFQNPAKNFGIIVKDLEKIAQDTSESMTEVIDMFISDLRNYLNEDYEKKVKNIDLIGISPSIISSLISYLDKTKKIYRRKDSKEKKKLKEQAAESIWIEMEKDIDNSILSGEQGTEIEIIERLISDIKQEKSGYKFGSKEKKYILNKLRNRLDNVNEKETEERKTQEAMKQIVEIVDREYSKGNVQNKANYLLSIKDAIIGKNGHPDFNIEIGKIAKEKLIQLIDDRIKTEKDEIYYEQVKNFTNNFQFLGESSEIVRAVNGHKATKFTDLESYNRFSELRSHIQNGYSEYTQINRLLQSQEVNEVDKAILTARKSVMDKKMGDKAR